MSDVRSKIEDPKIRMAVHDYEEEPEEEENRRRTRKTSEKARVAKQNKLSLGRDVAFNRLKSKMRVMQKKLEKGNRAEIVDQHTTWMELFEEFQVAHDNYCEHLNEQELEEYLETYYRSKEDEILTFKKKIDDWFKSHPPERRNRTSEILEAGNGDNELSVDPIKQYGKPVNGTSVSMRNEDEIQPDDSASQNSGDSKRSGRSRLSIQKFEHDQRKAVLIEQQKLLTEKQDLEMEKLKLKFKEDELKLRSELAEVNIKSQKIEEVIETRSRRNSEISLNPSVRSFVPKDQVIQETTRTSSPIVNRIDELDAKTLIQNIRRPTLEIKKFGGDPMDYKKFIRQFQSRIAFFTNNDDERIVYLEQFTYGQPNKIVSGYSYLPAEIGYQAALEELNERYGDKCIISSAYTKKVLSWPTIKSDNPNGLDEYGIFLAETKHAINGIETIKTLEYPDNLKKIIQKLPYALQERWRSVVQDSKRRDKLINFELLVNFVRQEARKDTDPTFGREAMAENITHNRIENRGENRNQTYRPRNKATFATNIKEGKNTDEECSFCTNKHSLLNCRKFENEDYTEQIKFLSSKGLCYGCLQKGHIRPNCKSRLSCEKCNGKHPSILHFKRRKESLESTQEKSREDKSTLKTFAGSLEDPGKSMGAGAENLCTFVITPVKIKTRNGLNVVETYAFLDPGSNVSFISKPLMHSLGLHGIPTKIKLDTMGQTISLNSDIVKDLEVMNFDMTDKIHLPILYSKDKMPVDVKQIPSSHDIENWQHLRSLRIPNPNCKIGLLIGNNVPDAYAPLEIITGPRGSPHASRTAIGWTLWGVTRNIPSTRIENLQVNHVEAVEEYQQLNKLDRMIRLSTSLDFPERLIDEKDENSVMDKKFYESVEKSTVLVNNHYEISLPFKNQETVLPDNKNMVLNRLQNLKVKLQKNEEFYKDYSGFMTTVLEKGYAEEIKKEDLETENTKKWYIPHHGVYHKKKNKLRIVFDCSAKYYGISLNDVLLSGPDLTNTLVGVLMRFRLGKIAFMSDIEAMFHQVKVPVEDSDSLRFFWWKDGKINTKPIEYRMTSHLFGAVSSPSIANFALQRTTVDFEDLYDEEIRKTILHNFYVDDCLKSVDDVPTALVMVEKLKEICSKAGFNLHKWVCNNNEILKTIPESERAASKQPSFGENNDMVERALGVNWDVASDNLTFKINVKNQPTTRRGILSMIASIYDPLGFAAPALLPPKLLLQELCHQGLAWDEQINDKQKSVWSEWIKQLPDLENVKIPRCVKTQDFEEISTAQVHSFSDASQRGYGVACYLRLVDLKGTISCSLILGKARVSPLKKIIIPRLELTAATTSVKLTKKIVNELMMKIDDIFYWTDSTAVLHYIKNEENRYKTFVANRVNMIRECTEINQWRYINTLENPADEASRGITLKALINNKRWFNGPDFLSKPESEWPNNKPMMKIPEEVEFEMKRSCYATNIEKLDPDPITKLLEYYSTFDRLKKALALLIWVKNELKSRVRREKPEADGKIKCMITAKNMKESEEILIKHEQGIYFGNFMEEKSKMMKEKFMLQLDPQVRNCILKVGGRLEKSQIPTEAKHQIILPKQSRLSYLLIQHTHQIVGHLGKNYILAQLRKRYWIIGASSIIKSILSRCVTCKRHTTKINNQKMASLPAERLTPNGLPFEYTGMDFFGPYEIKQRRSMVKRYGVIFTCLNTRAVHIEIAHSLDTDSCINALRRFIARRGKPRFIRSDNGTNLVGAEKELRLAIDSWDETKITNDMAKQNIDLRFNTPAASHHGGVWERIIRTIRKVLFSLQRDQMHRLNDESLSTLMCEVESIINSRPLTKLSDSPDDLDALTPNHLLLTGHNNELSPTPTEETDLYVRRRWRQVQYLTDLFWRRWTLEYLPMLQERKKWLKPQRNIKVGDVVMILDNSLRNSRTLARVIDTKPDRNGLVRIAKLKTQSCTLERPITKLCTLLEADD